MNHAADFGFEGEDTPAEERRREVLDRPVRRLDPARGRRVLGLLVAMAAAVGGFDADPLAPPVYVDRGPDGRGRRRRR